MEHKSGYIFKSHPIYSYRAQEGNMEPNSTSLGWMFQFNNCAYEESKSTWGKYSVTGKEFDFKVFLNPHTLQLEIKTDSGKVLLEEFAPCSYEVSISRINETDAKRGKQYVHDEFTVDVIFQNCEFIALPRKETPDYRSKFDQKGGQGSAGTWPHDLDRDEDWSSSTIGGY